MTVQGRKNEILRLIRRVSTEDVEDPQPPAAIARRRPPAAARDDLEALRQRRIQLEEKLLEASGGLEGKLPRILGALEQRVAAIEARLDGSAGAAGPVQPAAMPAARTPAALDSSPAVAQLPAASSDDVLSGRIGEGVLADILQMLSSNLATGSFLIKATEGTEFTLFFDEGQIVHATGVGLAGESALFAGMAIEEGRFSFRDKAELPTERTIGSKTQFLILEALRQIDESRAGGGGDG